MRASASRRLASLFMGLALLVELGLGMGIVHGQETQQPRRREGRGGRGRATVEHPLTARDAQPWSPTDFEKADPKLPTLFIASDSTAATGNHVTRGWGAVLIDYFDPAKVNIVNRAVGGRSFRTYTAEGRWKDIVEHLKPGDFVIIELGHNDGGGAKSRTGRGDVPGVGDETETVQRRDGTSEIVHTFGWYVRAYIREAREKGATPIVSTTTVRNIWKDGGVERGMGHMLEWALQVATEEKALFLDHANITADVYEEMGPEAVAKFFPQDHTHTSTDGAIVNAETLIAGLKTLEGEPLVAFLNVKGKAIPPHPRGLKWKGYGESVSTETGANPPPASSASDASTTRSDVATDDRENQRSDAPFGLDRRGRPLRFPPGVEPGMHHPEFHEGLPTLWLVGDSTVKEGRDTGLNGGRWGWGHEIGRYFDLTRINVENQALGGTSSRSFRTGGWWESVREMIRPGDFVVIQFGHNDGGINHREPRIKARGSLPGAGDDTGEGTTEKGEPETAHTYGWYIRQYVTDARAAGATPIVCSLIPRNTWRDGHVLRGQDDSYVAWAREAAEREDVAFINLNHLICETMDAMGEDFARGSLFRADDGTHTNLLGAQVNAQCVVGGVKALGDSLGLAKFLSPVAQSVKDAVSDSVMAAGTSASSSTSIDAASDGANGDGETEARLQLASPFTNHMVLQRELPVPVWGRAQPGSVVTVEFDGQEKRATADDHGRWQATLDPMPASAESRTLTVTASEGDDSGRVALDDVLVGEVWLASGQSNMDFSVAKTAKFSFAGVDNEAEVVAAANFPTIRQFRGEWTKAYEPQERVAGEWQVCTPENVREWSAAGYFFAHNLQQELDVPVGIVTLTFGASCAQAWIRRDAIAADAELKPLLDQFDRQVKEYQARQSVSGGRSRRGGQQGRGDPTQDQHNPTVMYNGMIAPVVPFAIRGVLWYQGESITEPKALFPRWNETLIKDWRMLWGRELPFYFVQLAAHDKDSNSPRVRAWQAEALKLPATGMAVTIDIGDRRNVHPRNKQDVGKRLALIALANAYGRDVEFSGPQFESVVSVDGALRLTFGHANGLNAKGGGPAQAVNTFEVAAAEGDFHAAEAFVVGDEVVLRSAEIRAPKRLRYAWANYPENPNLVNGAGLPTAPFEAAVK